MFSWLLFSYLFVFPTLYFIFFCNQIKRASHLNFGWKQGKKITVKAPTSTSSAPLSFSVCGKRDKRKRRKEREAKEEGWFSSFSFKPSQMLELPSPRPHPGLCAYPQLFHLWELGYSWIIYIIGKSLSCIQAEGRV